MKKKTHYAWAVLRKGTTILVESVFPRWLKLSELKEQNEVRFLTIFYNKKSAEDWKNHWNNKEDFYVERIIIPYTAEF